MKRIIIVALISLGLIVAGSIPGQASSMTCHPSGYSGLTGAFTRAGNKAYVSGTVTYGNWGVKSISVPAINSHGVWTGVGQRTFLYISGGPFAGTVTWYDRANISRQVHCNGFVPAS